MNTSYFNENCATMPGDAVVDRTIADQHIPRDRWSIFGSPPLYHRFRLANLQRFRRLCAMICLPVN